MGEDAPPRHTAAWGEKVDLESPGFFRVRKGGELFLADVSITAIFEGGELNHDTSNWWAPNRRAIEGMPDVPAPALSPGGVAGRLGTTNSE